MTEEEKELLLKDLCARWITDLKYVPNTKNSIVAYCTVDGIKRDIKGGLIIELTDRDTDGNALASTSINELNMVRPYLRPMSSMTKEEKHKLLKFGAVTCLENGEVVDVSCIGFERHADIQDYLNACHLDYRGLISIGLALEAPKGMYEL